MPDIEPSPWLSSNQEVADLEEQLAERTKNAGYWRAQHGYLAKRIAKADGELEDLRLKVKKYEEAISTALGCLHVINGEAGVLLNFWGEFATTHQDDAKDHLRTIRKRRIIAHKALCVEWRIDDATRRLSEE